MLEKTLEFVKTNHLNTYDIAIMTDSGIEHAYCQPCNACNAAYSVTKLFIVTMIGILYDKGLIRLDDKITDILSDRLTFHYNPIWDQVTIRHALTHNMGIEQGVIDIDRDDTSQYPSENYLEFILSYPPTKTPGTYRKYTDVPHYLLSLVIEKVYGKKADEAITEEILNPLHFASTSWAHCPQNHTIGSSGAYMSARDMVKLAWLYRNHGVYQGTRIVSEEWVRLTETEQYDLYPQGQGIFRGKGGLHGQMTMFMREKGIAVAWLAHEPDSDNTKLISWFEEQCR